MNQVHQWCLYLLLLRGRGCWVVGQGFTLQFDLLLALDPYLLYLFSSNTEMHIIVHELKSATVLRKRGSSRSLGCMLHVMAGTWRKMLHSSWDGPSTLVLHPHQTLTAGFYETPPVRQLGGRPFTFLSIKVWNLYFRNVFCNVVSSVRFTDPNISDHLSTPQSKTQSAAWCVFKVYFSYPENSAELNIVFEQNIPMQNFYVREKEISV